MWAGIPVGGLIADAAVAAAGLAPTLVAAGAACFPTTSLTCLRPEWREMDRWRAGGAMTAPAQAPDGTPAAARQPAGCSGRAGSPAPP